MLIEVVSKHKTQHILNIHKAKVILRRGVKVELAGFEAS